MSTSTRCMCPVNSNSSTAIRRPATSMCIPADIKTIQLEIVSVTTFLSSPFRHRLLAATRLTQWTVPYQVRLPPNAPFRRRLHAFPTQWTVAKQHQAS